MPKAKRLSRASVIRLELYLELLEVLQRERREFVTSNEIANSAGVTPVKVRQDLFGLGSEGRPKVGYEVSRLMELIRKIFDLDREKSACIIGFGNLGRALAGSNMWAKAGYKLVAVFDNDPAVISQETVSGLRVRSIAEIFGVIRNVGIEMAVLTVPANVAQEVTDLLIASGIRAIWNFAPTKLQTPPEVIVENQSLGWGLITLSHASRL